MRRSDKVAVVPAVIIVLHPRAPVFHPKRDNGDLAGRSRNRFSFNPAKFRHVAKLCPAKQVTRSRSGDHFR
jgi:hypothetical protein